MHSVLFKMLRNSVEFSIGNSETNKTSSSSSSKNLLRLLFDRPKEPIFLPKGDSKMIFVMPRSFYIDRYQDDLQPIDEWMNKETGDQKITIKELKNLPDLTNLMQLGIEDNFCFFSDDHRRASSQLVSMFMNAENVDELMVKILKNCI